jgi:hypothetical protein
MAAITVSAMQRAQEAALQSEGFVVKNCFIDESPCRPSEGARSRRHSAPPSPTRFTFVRHPESSFGSLVPRNKSDSVDDSDYDDDASTQASCSPGRHRCPSSADSACADDGGNEPIDGPDAADAGCEELRLAILDKCGFLRIVDSSYRPFLNRGKSDCSGSLMFYVAGLPWARRARWVVPLRLGVAKVLESCGYRTQMSVGVLYVSDPEGSYRVRISFAPSLASAR